jgi:hypothetical protein
MSRQCNEHAAKSVNYHVKSQIKPMQMDKKKRSWRSEIRKGIW